MQTDHASATSPLWQAVLRADLDAAREAAHNAERQLDAWLSLPAYLRDCSRTASLSAAALSTAHAHVRLMRDPLRMLSRQWAPGCGCWVQVGVSGIVAIPVDTLQR